MFASKPTTPVRGLASLLFCLSIGSAYPALALPDANETWIRVRTAHFTIVSNATVKLATGAGIQLERFQAVLEALHQGRATAESERSHLPTTILVFKDSPAFRPYKLSPAGTPESFVGKFTAALDGNYIGMSADPDEDPYRVIFHEFVHYFLSTRFTDLPVWENEGIAELYSTFAIEGNEIEVGRPIEAHVQFLGTQPLIPLVELFAIDTGSATYNEGTRQGVFYAESWALCHYLFVGRPNLQPTRESLREQLRIRDLATKEDIETAFGTNYATLEEHLRKYVGASSFQYLNVGLSGLEIDETAQVESVERAEVLYTLGDYIVHACPGRERDAEDHLREALRADSSHARAHASLARLIEKSRPAEAEANIGRRSSSHVATRFRTFSMAPPRWTDSETGMRTFPCSRTRSRPSSPRHVSCSSRACRSMRAGWRPSQRSGSPIFTTLQVSPRESLSWNRHAPRCRPGWTWSTTSCSSIFGRATGMPPKGSPLRSSLTRRSRV